MRKCARLSPPAADYLNDIYSFSPAANTWTALLPSGSEPAPRSSMGFAATPNGKLYVFRGYDKGKEGVGGGGGEAAPHYIFTNISNAFRLVRARYNCTDQ